MEKQFCDFLGCKYSYGVSSGTDALLLALMAVGIQPGDEVILPTYSFFATAGVVARLNAKPVLVDSDPVTFNINADEIESKITAKTKAIIPVHLYGQSADMNKIMEIAEKHNLFVIEDGAQAISSQFEDGRAVGTIGHIGCFSFFPSKNLGCFGDGGLVVTNNDDLAYKLKIMRVHGGDPKYVHKVIGGNFRIDALQAAVLKVKLPHLNSWSQKRRENANLYSKHFIEKGLATEEGLTEFDDNNKVLLPKAVYKNDTLQNYHIYNQYVVRVQQRDELRKFLTDNSIGTEIYYPIPFHLQECFNYLGHKKGDFTVAEFCADTSIALPIFPELSDEQINYVVDKFSEFLK
jgi:dTDP-4-amino-4,6-dideoxygalactose transaminase